MHARHFLIAATGSGDEVARARDDDGGKPDQVAQRYIRGRLALIRSIFLSGRVAPADFLLLIEPRLIVLAQTKIRNPLHKPALYRRLVSFIRPAI